MQVGPFRNGGTPTTKIGYVNCNGQECLGHRGKSGIGCYQKAYKMKCLCYVYGADGFEAERVIDEWMAFYNAERPHSALAGRTPAEAYRGEEPVEMWSRREAACPSYPLAQQQQDG